MFKSYMGPLNEEATWRAREGARCIILSERFLGAQVVRRCERAVNVRLVKSLRSGSKSKSSTSTAALLASVVVWLCLIRQQNKLPPNFGHVILAPPHSVFIAFATFQIHREPCPEGSNLEHPSS